MRKQRKLKLYKETISNLTRVQGGVPSPDIKDTGGNCPDDSVGCSVPFCNTIYPNECVTIGCTQAPTETCG